MICSNCKFYLLIKLLDDIEAVIKSSNMAYSLRKTRSAQTISQKLSACKDVGGKSISRRAGPDGSQMRTVSQTQSVKKEKTDTEMKRYQAALGVVKY